MLLEKRALWLRKEQARKKRAAEVHHFPPDFTTAIQYYSHESRLPLALSVITRA